MNHSSLKLSAKEILGVSILISMAAIGLAMTLLFFIELGNLKQGVYYNEYQFREGLEPVFWRDTTRSWVCTDESGAYRDCEPEVVRIYVESE